MYHASGRTWGAAQTMAGSGHDAGRRQEACNTLHQPRHGAGTEHGHGARGRIDADGDAGAVAGAGIVIAASAPTPT